MAHVYLKAGEKLTLNSGAVMTTGPYGGVIDAQIRWNDVRADFSLPANPGRTGNPYGFIELPSSSAGGAVQAFDIYLDLEANALWYDDRHGYPPSQSVKKDDWPWDDVPNNEVNTDDNSSRQNWLKAIVDALPDKLLGWLMRDKGYVAPRAVLKTLDEAKQLAASSNKKVMIAEPLEMVLVDKLCRDDALLLKTVLAMLATRFRAKHSEGSETFEAQLSALDKHVAALSLYAYGRGQITDLPIPRECIESLMTLPKLLSQIFSDSGYSTTVFIPLPSRQPALMLIFRNFAQRTGITLEVVIDR